MAAKAGSINYSLKYKELTGKIKVRYDSLGVTYRGKDNAGVGFYKSATATGPETQQYYYHSDHLGSSSLISDAVGGLVQHLEYLPFGSTFIDERRSLSSWHTPFGFNGKERDEETGLLYVSKRYQDGELGIWLSVDPLALKYPGVSAYAYCLNNPLKYVDYDGRDAKVVINKGVMTIKSQIYIYGSGANDKQAQVMQRNIMKNWNKGFSYTDSKTGETYKVNFDVSVQVYNKEKPSEGPGLFSNKNNPFSTANFVEVGATPNEVSRSFVSGGDEGVWRGYGSDSAPHEFGHLIGLGDHYTDLKGANPDWSGNIMAEPAGQGKVEQKNIDALAAPLIEQYHDSKQYNFNQNSKNCSQEFKTKINTNDPNK